MAFYRTITTDHTKVGSSTHTDFPILVSGTYSYLATVANGGKVENASGYDIGFYSDAALTVKLKWEIEKWVATTGEIVAWVKIASLSNSTDNVIYMGYGNAAITTDQSDAVNVWNSNFKGVWHVKDGTTLSVLDSQNVNNGTNNSATATTGKVDGGASFNGTTANIDIGAVYSFSKTTPMTLSCWINTGSAALQTMMADWNIGVTAGWEFTLSEFNAGKIGILYTDANGTNYFGRRGGTNVNDSTWRLIVATFDGSAANTGINLYVNGAVETHTNLSLGSGDPGSLGNTDMRIGCRRLTSATNQFWSGSLDEIRVSNVVRSADWCLAEYNNMSSPSTFYAVGSETLAFMFIKSQNINQAIRRSNNY